ncbi:DNA-binding domain-containing protein [Blastopirellula sp. JC732]|uniref:DNA-binding domain-containing protein n=1 Tax=Blastopirellula sediminis TaxID=2894196 RepID=A0A9X1SGX4_9BACT|nr:DNA-binding domain-containing protein [Blastopirellula sediminis]MCC9606871.1 DNA-binding domain-containing protein [Blastopirellula sediminis]MCC9629833.1 DNA-binding domain-containing protein [Blastopirellula sediminis]
MSEPAQLAKLQRWMQSVISCPGGVSAGIDASRQWIDVASDQVEQVIERSEKRTSLQRLQVYGNAYFARLVECMREQFPALCETLGQELFDGFALDYLDKRPSTSYTLSRLADQFVEHLEATRPTSDGGEPGWADFLIDLASFEWSVAQTFDGPGVEQSGVISPEDLAQVSPDQWPDCKLIAAPCLNLHAYRFPVNDYFTQFRSGQTLTIPPAEPTWLALSRRDYIVRRVPLEQGEFLLLHSLMTGESVGDAIEQAAEQAADLDALARQLPDWFRRFAREGFFVQLVKP